MSPEKGRMVVCPECGALYDIHYIDKVEMRKKGGKESIVKFECKNCGMVPVVYKNPKTLFPNDM